jgi:hypothetical protein
MRDCDRGDGNEPTEVRRPDGDNRGLCPRMFPLSNEEAAIRQLMHKLAKDVALEIDVAVAERDAGFAED